MAVSGIIPDDAFHIWRGAMAGWMDSGQRHLDSRAGVGKLSTVVETPVSAVATRTAICGYH